MIRWWPAMVMAVMMSGGAHRPPEPVRETRPAVTAFVDVAVLPMDPAHAAVPVLTHQTVVVRGSDIARFGPVDRVAVPVGAMRIDGRGRYLLPGFGDIHAMALPARRAEGWDLGLIEPALVCYLAQGVTTVRLTLIGAQDSLFLQLRDRVTIGAVLGPHLALVSQAIAAEDTALRAAAETAESLAARKAAGVDFVTLDSWQHGWPLGAGWLDSVAGAARRVGLPVAGTIPDTLGLGGALAVPYASIEHLEWYLDSLILATGDSTRLVTGGWRQPYDKRLVQWDSLLRAAPLPLASAAWTAAVAAVAGATRRAGVWNVPTQAQTEQIIALRRGRAAARTSPVLAVHRQLIRALADSGAGLLLGTGAPTWGLAYGAAVPVELARLVAAGLTPYEALATATRNVAAFLGTLDSTGTVAVGKRADLVLLAGNPLDDIRHTAQPAGVMLGGRWWPRHVLERRFQAEACH